MKLQYNGFKNVDIFNESSSQELFYVLENIKPAARVPVSSLNVSRLDAFCKDNNVYAELSEKKIIGRADPGKNGFSSNFRYVPSNHPDAKYWAYISKDKDLCKKAKHLDAFGDDIGFGIVMGYPECCIRFFVKQINLQKCRHMDFILPAITRVDSYPFYNNYALRYFGFSLISHFPCSLDCKNSQDIAQKNLAALRASFPHIANNLETHLKSFVIYTETKGVFYSNDYELVGKDTGMRIDFRHLNSTVRNELYDSLIEAKQIGIISYNKLKIGDQIFEGDDIGLLIFR